MELAQLQRQWNALGAQDPLWAMLAVPGKRFGHWGLDDFFEQGRKQVALHMRAIQAEGLRTSGTHALDFGCGVGRITQALGSNYRQCAGVDLAPTLIDQARKHNRLGPRCQYHVNARADLSMFDSKSFDFVYNCLVLQHIPPHYTFNYITEFIRVLAPGGVACFQLPAGPEPEADRAVARSRTQNVTPLPDSSFRARITPIDRPTSLWAGSEVEITFRVENLGSTAWRAEGAEPFRLWINLGNHWLDLNDQVVTHDDGRVGLPWDVEPGSSVDLALPVKAPGVPGPYLLEIDMVQEYVSWFRQKGSETIVIPIKVCEPPEGVEVSPKVPTYTIEKSEVIAHVEGAGGRVFKVDRVNQGYGQLDYFYYVTR